MDVILETPRLLLRPMDDGDFDALKKVISDPQNMIYYPKPYDDAGVQRWITWCKASYAKRGFGLWAVVLKESGEMIGDCGVSMQDISGELRPEIGYHLRLDMHRKGIGKEMASAVRDYFFRHFSYDEVYSYMTSDNEPSYKLAEANGMMFRFEYVAEGGVRHRVYSITREEWNAKYKN